MHTLTVKDARHSRGNLSVKEASFRRPSVLSMLGKDQSRRGSISGKEQQWLSITREPSHILSTSKSSTIVKDTSYRLSRVSMCSSRPKIHENEPTLLVALEERLEEKKGRYIKCYFSGVKSYLFEGVSYNLENMIFKEMIRYENKIGDDMVEFMKKDEFQDFIKMGASYCRQVVAYF